MSREKETGVNINSNQKKESKTSYKKQFLSVRDIVLIGLFAAFLAVVSQLSIPMPGGVPVTIQVFGVALVGCLLGCKRGTLAVLVYILVGTVGMPVFANFQGGLQVLVGTAGGYIMGWPLMALLSGIKPFRNKKRLSVVLQVILALIGLALVESIGGFWWAWMAKGDIRTIMLYSLAAFIPKDIVITILAVVLGRHLRKRFPQIES